MRKNGEFAIGFIILILVATLPVLMPAKAEAHVEVNTSSSANDIDSFTPVVWIPAWIDKNDNEIADSLDQDIADKMANCTDQDFVSVTITLRSAPTVYDVEIFASCGGYVTTDLWTKATYGFGGIIPYNQVASFARNCSDVLLIEKDAVCHSSLAYAAQQVGARTYVWNTMNLQGDPNSSIAVLDTGIDASHPDFSPGFGDQNFSKKIVGWNDQINGTATPFDDNGHGSHCAGLAAGDGFFSVDPSGNATATWGDNLGLVNSSGWKAMSGMMVNRAGRITINMKWTNTGTATLQQFGLWNGNKTLISGNWTNVNWTDTPGQNVWYSLTYDVATAPLGGYDMYQVSGNCAAGSGDLPVMMTMSWPYTPPTDGFSAWTGMAPQARLVGVKVLDKAGYGTLNDMIQGIDWIISNRMTYHITVASMSFGYPFENTTGDSKVLNLVNSGVTTVVAAGNEGVGSNRIFTPGSVDEVITVAAMNQFDNVASYSNQGGTSRYTGNTTKPDIIAPGGSIYAVPLFSVDSNNGDAEGAWQDVQTNDAAPNVGTSMATPIVVGAANLVIQAMGGYANWQYTRSQALQPKMILLMTATETYPNLRETLNSSWSPTLERGGKDVHEGYGRLNVDVAVDAVLKTYGVGDTAVGSLHSPPTLGDISALGQSLAWARKVSLVSGVKYCFRLVLPAGADYDLYLYNSTGTTYGEPAIVASSTTDAVGQSEAFRLTAPYTGTYYIVVKRATETTASGTFTLTSSSSPNTPTALDGPSPVTRNYENLYSTNNVTDPEGNQIRYHFNVTGPGTPTYQNTTGWVASSTPANLTVTWQHANGFGNYTLQTWVEDYYWGLLSNIYSRTVSMINEAPKKPTCPVGDSSGYVLTNYSYISYSGDEGGDDYQFEFNWNDSSPNTITYPPTHFSTSGLVPHNWSRPGLYNVTARGIDEWGAAGYWSDPKIVNITQNDDGKGTDAGNNLASATTYDPNYSNGTLYQSNPTDTQDWYSTFALQGQVIHIDMTPPSGCDFGIQLYDSSGSSKSGPYHGTNQQTIIYTADDSNYWYLKIYSVSGEGQYTFHIYMTGDGGGCPYVYAWNGTDFVKDNNILPASEVGNGTDVKDYYKLEQPQVPLFTYAQNSVYSLLIREFEHEIDYIDQVKLVAVDHPQGTNVAVTPEGDILTYASPASPISCIDDEGADRMREVATMNGNVSDPSTYFLGNKGDWLVLNFGAVTGPYANLILRDDWICDKVCLDVQVLGANGSWQTIESLHPRAFWSMEAVNMTAYLPVSGDFIIRLLWTTSHRLDYVGLDTSSPVQVQVTSRSPTLAVHSTYGVVTTKLLYDDENCVKLINGQQVALAFTMPDPVQGLVRDFIFYTNGYYFIIAP